MNHINLATTSGYEKQTVHYLISIASDALKTLLFDAGRTRKKVKLLLNQVAFTQKIENHLTKHRYYY